MGRKWSQVRAELVSADGPDETDHLRGQEWSVGLVWGNSSLVELMLSFLPSLNDVKRSSGVNRAARRARWPFETLSGHVTIRQMITRSGDRSYVSEPRMAEAAKLSDGAIGAMIEQLCSHRALTAGGSLISHLCSKCASTLRAGTQASAARAAFSLGYACVRSQNGWANAHAIVGACAHAALAAIAFSDEEEAGALLSKTMYCTHAVPSTPPSKKVKATAQASSASCTMDRFLLPSSGGRYAGWGAREACSWALVQLLSVAKKRHSCKSLVTQLRQLGVVRACVSAQLGSKASDAQRELCAQLLVLTCTGDADYVALVSKCPLEELCTLGSRSSGRSTMRARHAAQFAVSQGLGLPPGVERKRRFATWLVDEATKATKRAASRASATRAACWEPEDSDALAALALMAESCAEELASCGGAEACGRALQVALDGPQFGGDLARLVVADAAACLEQLALYYADLHADDDLDAIEGIDDDERAAIAADRASRRAAHAGETATALRDAPPSLALSLLSKLAATEPPIDDAWLRAVDCVVAYVAARCGDHRDDARAFVKDCGGDAFVDVVVAVERRRVRTGVPRTHDDPRFYFGAASETNALAVLAHCAGCDDFKPRIAAAGPDLLEAVDQQRREEERAAQQQDEEDELFGRHEDDDDEEDDDDDDDVHAALHQGGVVAVDHDDEDDEDIFIVLDHGDDDDDEGDDE